MYHIEIATLTEALEFTEWLRDKGKALSFNDSTEFTDWLDKLRTFPLQFYLDGITYELKTRSHADLFLVGFEAAMNLNMENV